MNGYAQVIQKHAERAVKLYAAKIDEIASLSRLKFGDDGSNGGSNKADVESYLAAIESVGGAEAATSAKMAMSGKARELGIEDLNL